eukprot:1147618-Pelagomonas_calceolata.AAC.3
MCLLNQWQGGASCVTATRPRAASRAPVPRPARVHHGHSNSAAAAAAGEMPGLKRDSWHLHDDQSDSMMATVTAFAVMATVTA